jgi:hypothetical protein
MVSRHIGSYEEHDIKCAIQISWVKVPKQMTNGHFAELAKAHGAVLATLDESSVGSYLIPGGVPSQKRISPPAELLNLGAGRYRSTQMEIKPAMAVVCVGRDTGLRRLFTRGRNGISFTERRKV